MGFELGRGRVIEQMCRLLWLQCQGELQRGYVDARYGRLNNGPQRHPHPDPRNLGMLPYMAKVTLQMGLRILQYSILNYPGEP